MTLKHQLLRSMTVAVLTVLVSRALDFTVKAVKDHLAKG